MKHKPKRKQARSKQVLASAESKPLLRPECEWFVYALTSTSSARPYIGKTNDLCRRLRQHNGEIAGGAKRTHVVLARENSEWVRQLHVSNFPDERAALNFEWRVQYDICRNAGADARARLSPLERALKAVRGVVEREKPTSVALPFSVYNGGGVRVHPETDEAQRAWTVWGAGAPHVILSFPSSPSLPPSPPSPSPLSSLLHSSSSVQTENSIVRASCDVIDLTGISSSEDSDSDSDFDSNSDLL